MRLNLEEWSGEVLILGHIVWMLPRLVLYCLVLPGTALSGFLLMVSTSCFANKYEYTFHNFHINDIRYGHYAIQLPVFAGSLACSEVANSGPYILARESYINDYVIHETHLQNYDCYFTWFRYTGLLCWRWISCWLSCWRNFAYAKSNVWSYGVWNLFEICSGTELWEVNIWNIFNEIYSKKHRYNDELLCCNSLKLSVGEWWWGDIYLFVKVYPFI